ncbi:MAG TPA: AraC family transcriptional regulator [Cytophagales bacterium]|nr:AraC family transcriptional regulator [Cytophagales bacterium]HAA22653.1 AraC family transcriptional regulator [Cytophagales bacterium]HAP64759.1 AraC family transcriptional regulator [Cytophagales bacterium]
MEYLTFEPNDELSPFIKCYWTLESPKEEAPEKQVIVPDGCMEFIFHYGDLYRQYHTETEFLIQPRSFVIGQLTQPLEIQPIGVTGIFSARFHPDGFLPFSDFPADKMKNTAISVGDLFGTEGILLESHILNAPSTEARIKVLERFLFDQLTLKKNMDRVIKSTVEIILTANGQLTIEALTQSTPISQRQLERRFAKAIGLSPKQLAKTIRLQTALKKLLSNNYTSLTSLAHEGEFYDQAHFNKDFKKFTGHTPREVYGQQLKMSSLFYGEE